MAMAFWLLCCDIILLSNDTINLFPCHIFSLQPKGDVRMHEKANVVNWHAMYPEKEYIFGNFTERLWAYLTIQQLLEKRFICKFLFGLW